MQTEKAAANTGLAKVAVYRSADTFVVKFATFAKPQNDVYSPSTAAHPASSSLCINWKNPFNHYFMERWKALRLFCNQKWIGSFAAVLGGIDTLVFSDGIGAHAPEVCDWICQGLQFLGIELDETRNTQNEAIVSTDASKVSVRVMQTNEELMIARQVCLVLNNAFKQLL